MRSERHKFRTRSTGPGRTRRASARLSMMSSAQRAFPKETSPPKYSASHAANVVRRSSLQSAANDVPMRSGLTASSGTYHPRTSTKALLTGLRVRFSHPDWRRVGEQVAIGREDDVTRTVEGDCPRDLIGCSLEDAQPVMEDRTSQARRCGSRCTKLASPLSLAKRPISVQPMNMCCGSKASKWTP